MARTPKAPNHVDLFDELRLAPGAERSLDFTLSLLPEGLDAVLVLNARLDTPRVAGYTPALTLTINDTPLAGRRLINKSLRMRARGGQVYSMVSGNRLATYYAPDFDSPDHNDHYGLIGDVKACEFLLRVTDLLRSGTNQLVVANQADQRVNRQMIVANARIEFRKLTLREQKRRPAPAGPLPVLEPRLVLATPFQCVASPNATSIAIQVGTDRFVVESRYSTPEGTWVTGSNRFFRFRRRVKQTAEAIIVSDTFTNLTNANLPVMQEHEIRLDERLKSVWLCGLEIPVRRGQLTQPANPTSLITTTSSGIGMLAMSDAMRIHAVNYATDEVVGLADKSLALPPKATYVAQWAIVPVDRPDYWRFINSVRRLVKANFTIPGAFCFFRASPRLTEVWSDEQTRNFLIFKDAYYACAAIGRYQGRYAHGTAFQKVDHRPYIRAFERRRRLVPEVKNLVYFHCFLDTLDEAPEKYPDACTLLPDGTQADYGTPHQRLFFPTENNSYGPAITRNVDIILDNIGADGVYWDEHEYSAHRYHYGQPWDGVSCDIDPTRLTIRRLKSSVTLLTETWRLALAKRILRRGPLIGNGPPLTRAMADLKFPCFVETGSITNCTRAHLYSPIALGDHLIERSEEDAYQVMLDALDYGCVYHWYNDMTVIPSHHHLTRYMFPITPLELHAGYIVGKERIVTKISGLFGWGDDSEHEVHVFDHTGREVADAKVSHQQRDGHTLSEIRLPENWSAAIIRR